MKTPVCSYCLQKGHTSIACWKKKKVVPLQKKPVSPYGKVAKRMTDFRKYWIKKHGGENGTWVCYLQIHPLCPKTLTVETLTLEHVIPKSRRPDLRTEGKNIKPACVLCNNMKGSKNLVDISKR